jgi:hypothetical protein
MTVEPWSTHEDASNYISIRLDTIDRRMARGGLPATRGGKNGRFGPTEVEMSRCGRNMQHAGDDSAKGQV